MRLPALPAAYRKYGSRPWVPRPVANQCWRVGLHVDSIRNGRPTITPRAASSQMAGLPSAGGSQPPGQRDGQGEDRHGERDHLGDPLAAGREQAAAPAWASA